MAYDEDVIELQQENSAYRARLATAENEITWLRSALVSLLNLVEREPPPLSNAQIAAICKFTLNKARR